MAPPHHGVGVKGAGGPPGGGGGSGRSATGATGGEEAVLAQTIEAILGPSPAPSLLFGAPAMSVKQAENATHRKSGSIPHAAFLAAAQRVAGDRGQQAELKVLKRAGGEEAGVVFRTDSQGAGRADIGAGDTGASSDLHLAPPRPTVQPGAASAGLSTRTLRIAPDVHEPIAEEEKEKEQGKGSLWSRLIKRAKIEDDDVSPEADEIKIKLPAPHAMGSLDGVDIPITRSSVSTIEWVSGNKPGDKDKQMAAHGIPDVANATLQVAANVELPRSRGPSPAPSPVPPKGLNLNRPPPRPSRAASPNPTSYSKPQPRPPLDRNAASSSSAASRSRGVSPALALRRTKPAGLVISLSDTDSDGSESEDSPFGLDSEVGPSSLAPAMSTSRTHSPLLLPPGPAYAAAASVGKLGELLAPSGDRRGPLSRSASQGNLSFNAHSQASVSRSRGPSPARGPLTPRLVRTDEMGTSVDLRQVDEGDAIPDPALGRASPNGLRAPVTFRGNLPGLSSTKPRTVEAGISQESESRSGKESREGRSGTSRSPPEDRRLQEDAGDDEARSSSKRPGETEEDSDREERRARRAQKAAERKRVDETEEERRARKMKEYKAYKAAKEAKAKAKGESSREHRGGSSNSRRSSKEKEGTERSSSKRERGDRLREDGSSRSRSSRSHRSSRKSTPPPTPWVDVAFQDMPFRLHLPLQEAPRKLYHVAIQLAVVGVTLYCLQQTL